MPGTTDTVKAMLTPGEFVIRKEAVDMIGVPTLEKLNDMPEAGGHSEIDRLIAQATLKNMTGMYGGGMVNAKQYMGGGMVDMYGGGGKVKEQMMSYEDGGQAMSNLKPVPDNNPGLAKLPEDVRNKMGYMQEGGSVLDMALRRAEPVDLLKEILQFEPPMAGKMYSQPKRNFFGELEEGQTYGKDILRPQEEKYLDHYESEHTKAKNNLIGFLPEDRELMFEFLNRSGVYDYDYKTGEERTFKNNPNFKVPENEKRLARKLIRIEEKIDKRRDDLEKRIRVDSASKVPSQLDKYPRNLLSEEERKELFDVREKIQNSKSYQSMEDDQSRLYSNRQRRELQEEFGLEPKEEYKSLFGFDPNRDRRALGEDPREYEGEAPSMYDLPERYRKEFYSQYQKPKTGLLNLLGFMHGGKAKKKKEMYGYQEGGAVQEDAMMQQYLQSLMAQQPQANPFVPFDQRPPSSGEVMSSIPSGMEQGDYYRLLRGELEMENEELVRDKAQNALERIRLDSLLKQAEQDKVDSLLMQGAVEIKSSPGDSFYFPNTPAQDNFMKKYKENMINPTYSPEGS